MKQFVWTVPCLQTKAVPDLIVLLPGTQPEITSSLWQLRRRIRVRGKRSRRDQSRSLVEQSRTYRPIRPKPQMNVPINNAPTVKEALSTAAATEQRFT